MLALHAVLAADGVATMVFDEVDAGVGGRAAAVVADKLAAAARGPPGALRDPPGADRGARAPPPARREEPCAPGARA